MVKQVQKLLKQYSSLGLMGHEEPQRRRSGDDLERRRGGEEAERKEERRRDDARKEEQKREERVLRLTPRKDSRPDLASRIPAPVAGNI